MVWKMCLTLRHMRHANIAPPLINMDKKTSAILKASSKLLLQRKKNDTNLLSPWEILKIKESQISKFPFWNTSTTWGLVTRHVTMHDWLIWKMTQSSWRGLALVSNWSIISLPHLMISDHNPTPPLQWWKRKCAPKCAPKWCTWRTQLKVAHKVAHT